MSIDSISIQIKPDNVVKLTEYLLTQKIPFSMEASSNSLGSEQKMPETSPTVKPVQRDNNHSINPLNRREQFAKQILERSITNDFSKPLQNETEIAEENGLTLSALKKLFKDVYNKPLYRLYLEKRMEHAAFLLKQGYRCNKVSEMVGYGEKSCIKFNKMFQKHFDITPKRYQMEYQVKFRNKKKW